MEEQITESIARTAADTALIIDEKILKIENHTLMIADIAGAIYTHKSLYRPHPLPTVVSGKTSPPEPYLHAVPDVDLSAIRSETNLVGNIGDTLRQITVVNRGIATSTLGGESGYVIAMDALPWVSTDFDPRLDSWYQRVKEQGKLLWTGVYADQRGRGPVISCAVPFYDRTGGKKTFKGAARSTMLLADFSKMIDSTNIGRTGYIFVLDNAGLKLFSSGNESVKIDQDGGVIGENYLESADSRIRSLGLSMTMGASGMTELDIGGLPVYVAYAPIHTLGWSLGVAIPAQEISAPARLIQERLPAFTSNAIETTNRHISHLLILIGITLFLILIMTVFFSLKFTKDITGPIISLNKGIQEISGGNMDRKVVIKTGDEIEELADSFNAMTIRLRSHIEQIASDAAEKERIATELDIAARIQTNLLPYNFSPFLDRKKDFDLYAIIHPAKEVGGDFYDFFFIDGNHFALIIADVSGKGIPAALFMALAKTSIKNHVQNGKPINAALETVNRQLCDNNAANMFVTLWIGALEISSGRMEYVNAGHNPPLLKTNGNHFAFLASPPDLFLGGMENTVYHIQEARLENNDTLYLYTDGVTEAADSRNNFYGAARLRETLDAHNSVPARELLSLILADIQAFSGGAEQSDDITMMALRITREEDIR
jgi:sigma-B regulation protein RsbU (phosphoserine phosphatase)